MSTLHNTPVPKRDSVALALLVAMGLAVAVTTGAALSGIASGAVQDLLRTAGSGRDDVIKAEWQRQAASLAAIERSLDLMRGEVGRLARAADATADAGKSAPSDIDLGALRTSLGETEERNRSALIAVNKRIDWLETLVYGHDATGSVTPAVPPAPATRANPSRRRGEQPASRWIVLHAQSGVAVIAGKGGAVDVTPGYVIPELGRVAAIRQLGGHWQVVTDKGTITQR